MAGFNDPCSLDRHGSAYGECQSRQGHQDIASALAEQLAEAWTG